MSDAFSSMMDITSGYTGTSAITVLFANSTAMAVIVASLHRSLLEAIKIVNGMQKRRAYPVPPLVSVMSRQGACHTEMTDSFLPMLVESLLRLLQGIGAVALLADLGMTEEIPMIDDVLPLLAHAPLNFAINCLAYSSSPLLLADTIATPSRATLIFIAKSANSFHHFPLIGRSR